MFKKWNDLTEQQKNEIKKKYESGVPPSELAKMYDLKSKQISDQAYRKGWKSPNLKAKKSVKSVKKSAKKSTAKAKGQTKK